jgi:branched-chain amino acid transport system substrate-binding protein
MEKFLRWSAGLVVLALILAACQPSASESPAESAAASVADPAAACEALPEGCFEVAPGDPIRIASALSISGAPASLGNDSNFGIDVAQAERGQVLGRDTDVVHEDAGCADAASGQTAAQAIVADPTILAVIGTSCSRTAVPAMPVLEEAGLIMISPSNTAPGLTNPDHEDYLGPSYFRTAYNDKVQGAAVARFVCDELGLTTAATIHDGSPYAEQLQQVFVDQFAEICDGTTTAQEAINIGDTDFRPVLTTIAADSPEVLFFPIFEPEGNAIIAQWDEVAGLANTIPISADGLKTGTFLDANGLEAQALGAYFSGPDLNFGDRYQNEFLPAYYKLSGTDVTLSAYHAHGYDAFNILMDAIEAAVVGEGEDGTLYVSKAGVREYVAGLTDYDGLTGTLTCDEFGDCGSEEVSIAEIGTNDEGNLDYIEVFTTRSAQ